jgi:hypothetical protein
MNQLNSILNIYVYFKFNVRFQTFQTFLLELKRKVKKLVRTKKAIRKEGLNIDEFFSFNLKIHLLLLIVAHLII